MIQQGFVPPWSIFTPTVFRMMRKEYVDRFFNTGELVLSSFSRFSKYEDEQRKDVEGNNVLVGRGPGSTLYALTVHGVDAYILCATAQQPTDKLLKGFQSDSAIQIFDTTGFAAALTKHIPGVKQGFEGYCFYTDGAIECKISDIDVEEFRSAPGVSTLDINKVGGFLNNIAGTAVFYRKRQFFKEQLEYRWVWITSGQVDDVLVIQAPEARDFCLPWPS